MKVKGGASPSRPMEEERRFCDNCKRDVAAANFSLHEAHCRRFLAVCARCQELVALKDMEEHLEGAHRQVRCSLCHQLMQQYLLERHEAEACPERSGKCPFCELELPHQKLEAHLDACGSRTTLCWDCGKYVMYKALESHTATCPASGVLRKDPEPKGHLCQQCSNWIADEQYLQHLNECTPLPQLLGALSTRSPTEPGPPPAPPTVDTAAEKDVRPKRKESELPSVARPTLKPPRSKKGGSRPAFTSTLASVGGAQGLDEALYDQLVSCSHCDILLPCPTLQKHEKKCRRLASLKNPRRSPRLLGKEEESLQKNAGEAGWQ
ncbi:XIAP-associated factor 1 isoform X2 [Elgaria multicarinata webbii]|uniref:XIAP-associated factor 1 isoform X2 n=1 Tax=Elgaria multicarinata webbii TaxID=159646 RepID=UPI002FCD0753